MEIIKFLFLALTFSWTTPNDGSPIQYYDVHVVDNYGQTIEIATTNSNLYTFIREGQFRVSVRGVDQYGRYGEWSVWSDLVLSNGEKEIWMRIAQDQGLPLLVFVAQVARTYEDLGWVDPHLEYQDENNE